MDTISIPKNVLNLYVSYSLNQGPRGLNTDFILGSYLFGSVKLAKNTNLDKYKCSGYGIGFDSRSEISFTDESIGNNFTNFVADMSSSVHIDNKNQEILILVKD